jgi:hypothetical protein
LAKVMAGGLPRLSSSVASWRERSAMEGFFIFSDP